PGMARLAALDAIMERVLGARERSLLSAVPALLGTRFERLRDAERQALADAGADGDAPSAAALGPGTWLDTFRDEMKSI
ncbi:DUF3348 family protein, partial [Paraburkholderia sp. SIMBA_027]|uniref:DUF3348 family protein n=1 Tax=Paraburkholderia sp. SIMBA_027 TaxID=3085770 RepID=UPI003979F40D